MDYVRSCYSSEMRTIDGVAPAPVKWFFTGPGAKLFKGPSPFRSNNWNSVKEWQGIGEQGIPDCCDSVAYPWHSGKAPAPYEGKDYCGTESAARRGASHFDAGLFWTNGAGQAPCCNIGFAEAPVRIAQALPDGELRKGEAAPVIIALNPFAELPGIVVEAAPVRIGDKPLSSQLGEGAVGATVRLGQWVVTFERDEVGIDASVDLGMDAETLPGAADRELCPVVLGVNPLSLDEEDGAEPAVVRIGDKLVSLEEEDEESIVEAAVSIGDNLLSLEDEEFTLADVRLGLNPPPEEAEEEGTEAEVSIGVDPATPTIGTNPVYALAWVRIRTAQKPFVITLP